MHMRADVRPIGALGMVGLSEGRDLTRPYRARRRWAPIAFLSAGR